MKSETSHSAITTEDVPEVGLRILHVVECYEAGVGHAVDTLVRIRRRDAHFLLYSGSQQPAFHFRHSETLNEGFLRRILNIRRAVRDHRPDVVHLHSSWAGVYGRMAFLRTPIVYQPHCFKFDDPHLPKLKNVIFRGAEKLLGRMTTVILALSKHEADLAKDVSPSAQCVMLPNTPTVPMANTTKELGAASIKRIVMVGRVSPQKDPLLFGEVADLVRETHPDAEFVWCGDGDLSLKTQLQNAGVTVTGWLAGQDLLDLLDSASCYVHTASYEGFPLSVLDAAARGVPIVVRQIPAFEGTRLLQGNDAAALADHIRRVLSDPDRFHDATVGGSALLSEMNEARQKQALDVAYGIAMESTK